MTTLHILSSPNNPVTKDDRIDPFSFIVWKFIKNMKELGWNCIHYGISGCNVDCETVICLNDISSDRQSNIEIYNKNAGLGISFRKKPTDLVLCFYGYENKIAADLNNDLKIIEPSIGYDANAIFAPYRIFASYAHMHYYYGKENKLMTPSWTDAVIPNAISSNEFDFKKNKDDYLLFFGRIIEEKGIHTAIQASNITGKKLIVSGPGDLTTLGYKTIPYNVEVVGISNVEQRKILMSNAKAIFGPTHYIEPFGNMIVEGYMSGTPAITTDWGGFTETVIQGVTGYRCRNMNEFVQAINNIDSIDPEICRNWAIKNCDDSVIYPRYDSYFKNLLGQN